MCEKFLDIQFEPQTSIVEEKFFLSSASIGFLNPEGKEITLTSDNLYTSLTGRVSFEITDKICVDSIVFLSSKAKISIEKLISGPFSVIDGETETKDLYIQMSNVVIFMDIKYFFNPLSICKKDFQDLLGETLIKFRNYFKDVQKRAIYHKRYYTTNGGLIMDVDGTKGVTVGDFYISEGVFGPPNQALTDILKPLITNYSTQFGVFYDITLVGIAELSIFSDYIRNEFLRIYCIYQKTNPYVPPKLEDLENVTPPENSERTIPVVPTAQLQDRLNRIQKLGWKSVISNKKRFDKNI